MLTPASAARSFSDFPANTLAAATDDCSRSQHAQSLDAPDHVSYFDAIMRLRGRRPITRRASRRN